MSSQYIICHHGIKGMKWGVRRYQYTDGTLTPAGKKRYGYGEATNRPHMRSRITSMTVNEITRSARTVLTGKQYVDTYLAKGTTFNRIQTSKDFENFAFYATYKRSDSNKYMGLFGKNLKSRAEKDARLAERTAKKTGDPFDEANAKILRDKSNTLKVYQLKISATKRLKVPSDENASDITANLLKEPQFKSDVIGSIKDSKTKMLRPQQQLLFTRARAALNKDPNKLSSSEKIAIYKALNLSLTNHNAQEISAQARFYGELKKKGYNALLDYNDKEYSSYHAKRPMIIFDTDSVKLQAVTETNPKVVNMLYKRYNMERIFKESLTGLDILSALGSKSLSECEEYVNRKLNSYCA